MFDHFSNLFDFDDREKEHVDREAIYQCQAIKAEVLNRPIETDEVLRAVNKLQLKKATGADSVMAEIIRGMGNVAIEFMKPFLIKLLKTSKYPTVWSSAIIVPKHEKRR